MRPLRPRPSSLASCLFGLALACHCSAVAVVVAVASAIAVTPLLLVSSLLLLSPFPLLPPFPLPRFYCCCCFRRCRAVAVPLPCRCLCLPLKFEISNGFVDFLTQRRAAAHFLGTTSELCHPERSVPTLFPAKIASFRFSRRDAQSRDLSSSLSKTEDLNRAISNLKFQI